MRRRAALTWSLLLISTSAGCTGVTIENTTLDQQDVNAAGVYQISANIVRHAGVREANVEGFVVIGTHRFPMTHGNGNAWDYTYHAVTCEQDVRYSIVASYTRPHLLVKQGPVATPADSFVIRRPQEVLWDSDKKVAGAEQISLLIDLSTDAAAQRNAALAKVSLYNPLVTPVTMTGVSIEPVPFSATGGGPRDVPSFQPQALPVLPTAVGCDETLDFGVHFTKSTASRSAQLLIHLNGAPSIPIALYGKAFF